MLIYASSKSFPHKTFVLTAKPKHTIARVRAQLLHVLYEFGREDHQFRLRFNGQYLKDSLTLEDYGIVDNAVLKMIPMSADNDSLLDVKSLAEGMDDEDSGALGSVRSALYKEVATLDRRQFMVSFYHGLLSVHFLGVMCGAVSSYWYIAFYLLPFYLICSHYAPRFSRTSGFTGNYALTPKVYCWLFAVLITVIGGVSVVLLVIKSISIVKHGCPDQVFVDECSHHNVYTAVFLGLHAIFFFATAILLLVMVANFRFQPGDYIEKLLVQMRDLQKILESAKSTSVKEKRMAAFELAAMAATSDDNKFLIVAEGGLDTLISLGLSQDLSTQEYAAESLAELLTVPQIQDKFVEIGGVKHLTALLHSRGERCVQEAMTAISYVVQDSEQNKHAVIADRGLEDLSKVAYHKNLSSQRTLAGVFLELLFNKEICDQMASMNTPAQALIHLCQVDDEDTQGLALQSLELLAIESPEMLRAQEDLISVLLEVAHQTVDPRRQTVAAKLLLYYAEQRESCERLVLEQSLSESLMLFAKSTNPTLQKVIVKIIQHTSSQTDLRIQALELHLDQVLLQIKHNAADREAWNMADSALQMMQSSDDLSHLPVLSTADKVSRMHSTGSHPGSITSLRSLDQPTSRMASRAGSQRSIR
ncbi:uncharacterized protein [Watersipora subatra]|uniref:uncharacterized protein n=1 Tax=Watersipora subatra TaxID=2589382 RepID=UPI00355C14B9